MPVQIDILNHINIEEKKRLHKGREMIKIHNARSETRGREKHTQREKGNKEKDSGSERLKRYILTLEILHTICWSDSNSYSL